MFGPDLRERVIAAGARPVDIASLAAFRIIFGLVMFGGTIRFLGTGWIEQMYGEPTWFFTYPGFDWVAPWPAWGMYLHYALLGVLALAIALGAFHRIACVLYVVGFSYSQLVDVTNYLNHHYLVVLVVAQLAVLPAADAWSIDAWRRPERRRSTIPAWIVWLVRFQIGVVYVFAGLAKAKVDWLAYGQPLNLWLSARTETPLVGQFFDQPWAALAMSWAGFVFDTTIVAWLSWRRTRPFAYVAVIVFHGATGYLFNIGMFPIIMTASALIFFSPSWPRRVLARIGAARWAEPRGAAEPRGVDRPFVLRRPRLVGAVVAAHVVLQIALPLRHHLYPGPVLWNEDGMRFAWHVLIREKHGSVTFIARFANGKQLEIPPGAYLTWRQEREMGGQPDLILQLAHAIARDLRARGHRDFTLHAITAVSLNGRPPAPLIDPSVDLARITDRGPRDWVLPAPTSPPPILRPLPD